MPEPQPPGPGSPVEQRCHRHPDREAYIRCQRCEQLICPQCMNDAAVGFHCPTCVAEGARTVRAPKTIAGGRIPAREGLVTMVLIAVNVGLFVLTDLARVGPVAEVGAMVAANVVDEGGTIYPGVADGGYWRLITSAFLHGGLLHLLFNMYALYLFGPFAERALGTGRFVAAYATMAVVSSVFVYWLSDPRTFTVGASGAVFGLFGLALVLLVKAREDVRGLLVLLAINGVISLQANISWQGHLGGFLAGLVLGLAFAYAPRERRTLVQVLVFAALWVGVVVGVATRTAYLLG